MNKLSKRIPSGLAIVLFAFPFFLSPDLCEAQYSVLHYFGPSGLDGGNPSLNVTLGGKSLYSAIGGGPNDLGIIYAVDTDALRFRVLYNMDTASGFSPHTSLLLHDSLLYGMTAMGGMYNEGTVFSIDTDGSHFTKILDFNGPNGASPSNKVFVISGTTLFGMTHEGGADSVGCIFSINLNGNVYKKLYDFNKTSGGYGPQGGLTLSVSGKVLYGMTNQLDANHLGTIFSIDTDGTSYKVLYTFNASNAAGSTGSLTLSGNKLYGMVAGGKYNYGAIFSVDTDGSSFTEIYNFLGTTGSYYTAYTNSLLLSGNYLLGMSPQVSISGGGLIFSYNLIADTLKDLFLFSTLDNGQTPLGDLTLSGNALYGTALQVGVNSLGVVFKYDSSFASSINPVTQVNGALSLYPNPFTNSTTISIQNSQTANHYLELDDITGRVLRNIKFTGNSYTLSAEDLAKGMYFVRIFDIENNVLGTMKVVVQ